MNNSLHLARKYARIFVRGHYLFREGNSFPRAKLEENCELRGKLGRLPKNPRAISVWCIIFVV